MSEQSKIEWCDATANFWTGCTKVSAGCANCYAEARDKRHLIEPVDHWGKGAPRLKSKSAVKDCRRWNQQPWICNQCGQSFSDPDGILEAKKCFHTGGFHRRRVFSLSLGDWLDPEVPIEWLAEMLDTIRRCDQLIFILCTKRPELWSKRLREVLDWDWEQPQQSRFSQGRSFHYWLCDWQARQIPPKNIWLLTSVENQAAADERIPALLKIPAVVRGLSLEPLLEPVNLGLLRSPKGGRGYFDWLIIGGESGPGAREFNVSWADSLIAQGRAAGVPVLVKQLGSNCVTDNANLHDWPDDAELIGGGDASSPSGTATGASQPLEGFAAARVKFKHPKGGDWNEWPEELRVRQFPCSGAVSAPAGRRSQTDATIS